MRNFLARFQTYIYTGVLLASRFSGFQKADSTQPLVKAVGTKFRSYFLRGQEFPFPIYKYYYMYMQKSERHKEDAYARYAGKAL